MDREENNLVLPNFLSFWRRMTRYMDMGIEYGVWGMGAGSDGSVDIIFEFSGRGEYDMCVWI